MVSNEGERVAPNYDPLPITIARAEGAWVEDGAGVRYLDLLSAYSALSFGHRHPRLVEAARRQLDRVTLTSRAFGNDQLTRFCERLADLCGLDLVLPMNTGAEAVETGIKAARRWGSRHKGVPRDTAEIIVCEGNFHGRTTTIVSFSSDDDARDGFGPFTPGFRVVAFGDLAALRAAVSDNTVAILLEPIQGEAGVRIPPEGYLRGVRQLCDETNTLFIADEIQSGLARTGRTFACDHEDVRPDVYLLGKALGGGIVPLSAVVSRADVLGVLTSGRHGSTFGGNPLACAVGLEVLDLLGDGSFQARAEELGGLLRERLGALPPERVTGVRSRGLWAGIDLAPELGPARNACERLLAHRVLVKEAHGTTLRLAPPLMIATEDLEWGCDQLAAVISSLP